MVAREPRLVQSRFDWHQESYKGGISLNGVSLNTFTSLVVWRYQREDLQTFEEAGKGVQLILPGHRGFEACGLGLVLSLRLRGDLPGLVPFIRSQWDQLFSYFWWSRCLTKLYEEIIIFMAIIELKTSFHGL